MAVHLIIVPSISVTQMPCSNVAYLPVSEKTSVVSECTLPKFMVTNFKDLITIQRQKYALQINCGPPLIVSCLQPQLHVQGKKNFIVLSSQSDSN